MDDGPVKLAHGLQADVGQVLLQVHAATLEHDGHPANRGRPTPNQPAGLAAIQLVTATVDGQPAPGRPGGQDWMKASRSALIVSAWVVGMPCGNPWYVFSVPFCTSFADSGPESA